VALPRETVRISDTVWEIPRSYKTGMRVPARIYATEKTRPGTRRRSCRPGHKRGHPSGIVNYAYCMPDGHWGYGFPIGGLAAMDVDEGVISPGGIGSMSTVE